MASYEHLKRAANLFMVGTNELKLAQKREYSALVEMLEQLSVMLMFKAEQEISQAQRRLCHDYIAETCNRAGQGGKKLFNKTASAKKKKNAPRRSYI